MIGRTCGKVVLEFKSLSGWKFSVGWSIDGFIEMCVGMSRSALCWRCFIGRMCEKVVLVFESLSGLKFSVSWHSDGLIEMCVGRSRNS